MIYQLQKVNIKRTTTRKFLCSSDNSGVLNVFTMLQELVSARGILLIGSYGEEPILEDKEGNRFRARCKGRGIQRWVELRPSKVANPLPIELIPPQLNMANQTTIKKIATPLPTSNDSDSFADLSQLLD